MVFRKVPVKLHDCFQHGIDSGSELFIVEGDSASKAVARARCPRTQAVLPMQGKPLNAAKASRAAVARYELYQELITALGTDWDDSFDLTQLRYDRVILLFDPDADGIHCGALLMMFFHRWMRPLLESGRVGVVHPPLFEITAAKYDDRIHAYSDEHYHKIRDAMQQQGIEGIKAIRYRGLASLNDSVLSQTCLDPETRKVNQLGVDDAIAALTIFSSPINDK